MQDNAISGRSRMPTSHPTLTEITINILDFYNFRRFEERTDEINIIGHDEPKDGMITVFVACASESVKMTVMNGWG